MFERPDAPPLLIEEGVLDDAANGHLGILLDRIVLEVLVAAVAVEQMAPVRVALADPAQQGQRRRGALDVERLVVLDDADRLERIDPVLRNLDRLEKEPQVERVEELPRLFEV